jgi:hypothetical protein
MKVQLPIRREPNDESTVKAKLAKAGITIKQCPQQRRSWSLDGIDFQQVLRYNVTYYDNTT